MESVIDNVLSHFPPKQSIVDGRADEKNSWKDINIKKLRSCRFVPKKNDTGARMAACLKLMLRTLRVTLFKRKQFGPS